MREYPSNPTKIAILMEDVVEEGFREMAAAGVLGAGALLGGCNKADSVSAPETTNEVQHTQVVTPMDGDVVIDNNSVIRFSPQKTAAGVIVPTGAGIDQEWCQAQLNQKTGKTWRFLDQDDKGKITIFRFGLETNSNVARAPPSNSTAATPRAVNTADAEPRRVQSIFDTE